MQSMRTTVLAVAATLLAAASTPLPIRAQAPAAVVNPQTGTEMATYNVVLLRRGPAWTSTVTPATSALSKAHMENIDRLTKSGEMLVAGPFLDQAGDRALTGMFILRAPSIDGARAITDSDPAVKAGRFVYDIAPWMAPASLRR
jgi:uncharacterized protein YciI